MSGVWVFKSNGVIQLVENPAAGSSGSADQNGRIRRRTAKGLVYLPAGEVVTSYSKLQKILKGLGWEIYCGGESAANPNDLLQFHKSSSIDLISLPRDFPKFSSVYMYDIVVKNPNLFHVKDL
uniref:Flowering-promoting factor 1 n=1 Tax=Kalanchoe fedtschenkoi TaxID=63787 RepID=A0A7N0VFB1_KALFE